MDKHRRFIESQRGQSIVIIALAMMAMLALAGLAIDGGNLFLQRRRAQNAADAGALAGTRVLAELLLRCADGDSADDAQVAAAVTEMVETNGFSVSDGSTLNAWYVDKDSNRKGTVGGGGIPNSATGVEVQLGAAFPTHFIKVVGIDTATVGADATAMAGQVKQLEGGILPIGVPKNAVDEFHDGDLTEFYVLEQDGRFCRQDNGSCFGNEGDPDSQRGWLNLNYIYDPAAITPEYHNRACSRTVGNVGCEAEPPGLFGYASGECGYPWPIWAGSVGGLDYDFIHGNPGGRNSMVQAVYEYHHIDELLYAPVFDRVYESDELENAGLSPPEAAGELGYECDLGGHPWPTAGDYLYHVVGFVGFNLDPPHRRGKDGTKGTMDGVQGKFVEKFFGVGAIAPSDGFGEVCEPDEIFGVNLWD